LDAIESQFDFEIAVYSDLTYTSLLPINYKFNVPETIHIGVSTTAPNSRYHLSVENCFFTQDPNADSAVAHQVMENGCPTAEVNWKYFEKRYLKKFFHIVVKTSWKYLSKKSWKFLNLLKKILEKILKKILKKTLQKIFKKSWKNIWIWSSLNLEKKNS